MNKQRKNAEGVSAVIAVILMVAITVVLAGVLYVWVMGMANTETSTSNAVGVVKDGQIGGYEELKVASRSGSAAAIEDVEIKIKRDGAAIDIANFAIANMTDNGVHHLYEMDTTVPADGVADFKIIDNDMDGHLTVGDTILIKAANLNTGDKVDIVMMGNSMSLTQF